jgi:hypothetical protein
MRILVLPDLIPAAVEVVRKFAQLRELISVLVDDPDIEGLLQLHLTQVGQQYAVVADALIAAEEIAVEVPVDGAIVFTVSLADDDLTALQQLEEALRASLAEIIVLRGEEELQQEKNDRLAALYGRLRDVKRKAQQG